MRNQRRFGRQQRWGLTLVELVVGLVASSLLMAGLAATLVIARKASSVASVSPTTIAASAAVHDLSHDLTFADRFVERTANSVEFTVPDRNDDDAQEQIRYQWSGVAGDPLYVRYNAGPLVQLLPSIQQFGLSYATKQVTSTGGVSNLIPEMLYISEVGQDDLESENLTSSQMVGQWMLPTLPANAVSWRISRVRLRLKSSGSTNGVAGVQVRTAILNGILPQPSSIALAEATLYESRLSDEFAWYDFNFIDSPQVGAATHLCIVLRQIKDSVPCVLEYRDSGASSNTGILRSILGGLLWLSSPGETLQIRIYGTVTTSGLAPASNLQRLENVGVLLQVGEESSRLETTVPVLNRPEVDS